MTRRTAIVSTGYWTIFPSHERATCWKCGQRLVRHSDSGNAPGRGKYVGRCPSTSCGIQNFYDLTSEVHSATS
jgi:hypothetical protein